MVYSPQCEMNLYGTEITYYGEEMGHYVFCTFDETVQPMTGVFAFWELTPDKIIEMANRMEKGEFQQRVAQMIEAIDVQLSDGDPPKRPALVHTKRFLDDILVAIK